MKNVINDKSYGWSKEVPDLDLQFVWKAIWTSHTSKNRKNYYLSPTYSSRFIFRVKSLLLYGFPLLPVSLSIQCFHIFFIRTTNTFSPSLQMRGTNIFLECCGQTVNEHFQRSPKNAVLVWNLSLSIQAYVKKVWAEVLSGILSIQGLTKAPQSVSLNEFCYFYNSVPK